VEGEDQREEPEMIRGIIVVLLIRLSGMNTALEGTLSLCGLVIVVVDRMRTSGGKRCLENIQKFDERFGSLRGFARRGC
jgi:hypothetical protein